VNLVDVSRAFLARHCRPNSANILLSAQGPRRAKSESLADDAERVRFKGERPLKLARE